MAKRRKQNESAKAGSNGVAPPAGVGDGAALTGHQRPGGVQRASYVEALPCKIDEEELAATRDKLVTVTCERVGVEAEIAGLKERLKGLKKREDSLAASLQNESEVRDVTCVEIFYLETNSVDVVRTDTGEVVRTRAATAEDRQEDLAGALASRVLAEATAKGVEAAAAEAEQPNTIEPPVVDDGPREGDITDPDDILGGDGQQPGGEG